MILLVTGGCGFIASHFINYFFDTYPDVKIINLDAMYYCANHENLFERVRKSDRYTFVKGRVQNFELVSHILSTHNITHVIHFAAQSHVQNSFTDALQYTNDNIVGTHTLLEACRTHDPLERFIHVSTDEVYGESPLNSSEKKTDESVMCPTNPYAATKASAELIVMSYYHSFKMPIIITRGNNVFGPRQYDEKLIPRFISLLRDNKPVTIQGDGSHVRSFLYVDDVVRAFDIILEKGKFGEIYNIGGEDTDERSVMYVAKLLIQKIIGTTDYESWIEYIEDRPFNDIRYYICNKNLKSLGWRHIHTFEEGIDKILSSN